LYINNNEIIISLKKRVVKVPDKRHIQIKGIGISTVVTFTRKPYGKHGFDVDGYQEALFIYRYSCESNTWELVESK